MKPWIMTSLLAALFFGIYNIFTKLAAGRLSDSLAAFVVEFSAAALLLGYLFLASDVRGDLMKANPWGILYAVLAGVCVAVGSVLYFNTFRNEGTLSVAGTVVWAGSTFIVIAAGLILFREKLDLLTASGFILTLTGIAILSYAVSRS